jgi:CheY-like chemotaxis protein
MVAVVEAAETIGVARFEEASAAQMTKAWGLVRKAASIGLEELTRNIAHDCRLPVADLGRYDRSAARVLPASAAHHRNVLVLSCTDRDVSVATANPLNQEAKREIAALSGRSVHYHVAAPSAIAAAVVHVYGPPPSHEADRGSGTPAIEEPKGPHVLVVDDEAGQRALMRSVLEEAGFRVDVVPDGPGAVDLLTHDATYDLITLDYWMERMNGLRVLQHVRAHPQLHSLPVIMVTGAEDRQIEMSLFEAGADDYVSTPIDGPLLALRVQAVLRRSRHV